MIDKINIESEYEYATLNRKIIAFGIDILIITLVLSPILNLLMILFFGTDNTPIADTGKFLGQQNKTIEIATLTDHIFNIISSARWLIVQFTMLFFVTIYFVYFWVKMGASVGKLVMRCKIVDANTYQAITTKQALMRMLGHLLNILTLGIGLFIADFTKRKQGLHDKIANTVVDIRTRSKSLHKQTD